MKRIHDGEIGDITVGPLLLEPGQPLDEAARVELDRHGVAAPQLVYFTWLSGDHIVEQHVHNLDVVNWALGAHPVRAVGMGGRQVRTGPEYGHIFDHFADRLRVPQRRPRA